MCLLGPGSSTVHRRGKLDGYPSLAPSPSDRIQAICSYVHRLVSARSRSSGPPVTLSVSLACPCYRQPTSNEEQMIGGAPWDPTNP